MGKLLNIFLALVIAVLLMTSCDWFDKDHDDPIVELLPDTLHFTYKVYVDSFTFSQGEKLTSSFGNYPFPFTEHADSYLNVSYFFAGETMQVDTTAFFRITEAYVDTSAPQIPYDLQVSIPVFACIGSCPVIKIDTVYEHRVRGINYAIVESTIDSVTQTDTAYYGYEPLRYYQTMATHGGDIVGDIYYCINYLGYIQAGNFKETELFNEWASSAYKFPFQVDGANLYLLDVSYFGMLDESPHAVFYCDKTTTKSIK